VAAFLGFSNLIPATVEQGDPTRAQTALGALTYNSLTQRRRDAEEVQKRLPPELTGRADLTQRRGDAEEVQGGVAPGAYTLLIRPEALHLGTRDGLPVFTGTVEEASFRGNATRVELLVQGAGVRLVFAAPPDLAVREGDALTFHLDPTACALLPPSDPQYLLGAWGSALVAD
jgi:ABC-type Fe3+/spermidine/putrescine transport system ATPase subunit